MTRVRGRLAASLPVVRTPALPHESDELARLVEAEQFGFRMRWLLLAASAILVLVWPPRDPWPMGVVTLLLAYNLAGWWIQPRLTTMRRARRSAVATMALLNVFAGAIAFSYSYIPESPGWLVFYFMPMSAAMRFGVRASIPQAAVVIVLDAAAHYYAMRMFGMEFDVPALVLRGAVYSGIAAFAGAWSATVARQQRELNQAAAEQASLRAAAEERARRFQALTTIQREITERLDLGEVCQHLAQAAVQLLGADQARVWVRSSAKGALEAAAEARGDAGGATVPDDALARAETATAQVVLTTDPRLAVFSTCLQMRFEDRVVGVLGVAGALDRQPSADQVDLLRALAASGAIAIENARLFEVWGETQAARRLDQMKSEFIGTISHELRTPLTSILGFAELVTDMSDAPPPVQTAVTQIRQNSEVMARLVDDLLTFAQFERGNLLLRREQFDLGTLAAGVVASLRAMPGGDRLRIEGCGAAAVDGDRVRVYQVISNLVTNALRYAPNGPIVVRFKSVPEGVRVEVEDVGPGIPADEQVRVWERFYRGRGVAGVTGARATGLGLAVVQALVEAHGGRVGLESPTGAGATFWFELPSGATRFAAPAAAAPSAATIGPGPARSLLELGSQIGQEFPRPKRLVDVVIGPGCEGRAMVLLLHPSTQHHDAQLAPLRVGTQLPAHLEAVDIRQPDVQQDDVGPQLAG